MSNLRPWVSKSHGSPVCEYLASPVLWWPALLPLTGMLWCCAPGNVASPSRLMALGTPQEAQCVGLLIDKSTIRMLMFMNYFWQDPRPSLGWIKLRAGPQDSLGRWYFQKEPLNTKQKTQTTISEMRRKWHIFLCLNIGARLHSGHCYFGLVVTYGLRNSLGVLFTWEGGRLSCTVQSSVLSTCQGWYWWMQSALKFHMFFFFIFFDEKTVQ